MKMKIMTVVILAILNPVSSIAQEAGGPLDVSLAIGYVGTSGNTKTTTFNSEILANYRTENWLHNVKFQALGSTEDSTSKAERYYLEDKSDFFLNSEDYLFAKGSYNDDRFSGFEYQATLSAGYGRYLINNDNFTFQGFGGAGYRINDVINAVSQDEVIFSI